VSERGSGLGPFVFGVIIGAMAGVLLAPARGEVTRRRLGRRVDDLRDLAEEKIDQLASGFERDEDADDEAEAEGEEPSAREELERRLHETRRRRRVERTARGRTRVSEEDDEPVA